MFDIVDAELIEGNYVLYQGDLSTKCWKRSYKSVRPHPVWPEPEKWVRMPRQRALQTRGLS
ncbi:hypothetical protein BWR15_05735 [Pseudomonas sp. T]|nr:hypothetical protein BWR15_05735 [Pseudomonas sp. T]